MGHLPLKNSIDLAVVIYLVLISIFTLSNTSVMLLPDTLSIKLTMESTTNQT